MIDKLNSAMRASEVAALTKTLKIINAKVVANSQVSKCALIQESAAPIASAPQVQEHVDTADADIGDVDRSFLQVGSLRSKLSFLAKAPPPSVVSEFSRRDRAMKSLAQRSSKLKSPSLEALALRAAADPLLKVKHGGPLVLPPAAT